MTTVRVRATRAEVKRALHALPAILAGKAADPTGAARTLSLRLGMTALSFVKQAFAEKAAGGADASGLRWEPLKPATVRGRRQGRATGTVQIGRDTGVLMNSLSPGAPDNVLDAKPGLASVGTSCPYAEYFHADRPLWPEPENWPKAWLDALARQLAEGALQAAVQMTRGAG
jgi:hypothetical protein